MAAGGAVREFMRRGWSASDLARRLHGVGPYLLVELILPGGTLIALLMYVFQQKRPVLGLMFARVRLPRLHRASKSTQRGAARPDEDR